MAMGCCHNFKKCSDAGYCLYEIGHPVPGDIEFEECLYKENLDKGLNFYTEYNENNKLIKEKYEAKQLDKDSIKVIPISAEIKENSTETVRKSTRTYLEIPNRLFLISKRGYGGWGKSLDDEDKENLTEILKEKGLTCHTEDIESMLKDEEIKGNERCDSRVILKIGDSDYTIQNYNIRCLKNETAVKIASHLIKRGLDADIEIMQGFKGSKIIKSLSTNRIIHKKAEEKSELNQISMFGEQVSSMGYVN